MRGGKDSRHCLTPPTSRRGDNQASQQTGSASRLSCGSMSCRPTRLLSLSVWRPMRRLGQMNEEWRLCCLALYCVGPVVALVAVMRRGLKPLGKLNRVKGWRGYIPTLLLPVEWLLPPALIFVGVGEIPA